MSEKREVVISIDVETDGPLQGVNSMLSLGAASFSAAGEVIGTFQQNLEPFPGQIQDPVTMSEFWTKNPDAWAAATKGAEPPQIAMGRFDSWLKAHSDDCSLTAVGYPIAFDLPWVRWYTLKCGFPDRLGFSGLDIKTLAMAALRLPYRKATKRNFPSAWFKGLGTHSHVAAEDALEQGHLYFRIRKALGSERST